MPYGCLARSGARGKHVDITLLSRSLTALGRLLARGIFRLIFLTVPALMGTVLVLISEKIEGHHLATRVMEEIGFALLVATAIWLIFEAQLRFRSENEFSRRLSTIAENVFHAVLGTNLPKELVQEIHRVALAVRLVRDEMRARYLLCDGTYVDSKGQKRPFVELHSDLEFKIINVSSMNEEYTVGTALPNPIAPELQKLCGVLSVEASYIDGRELKLDLKRAEARFRQQMASGDLPNVPYHARRVVLKPGEGLKVRIQAVMAKEEEDAELLELTYPARSLTVDLVDSEPSSGRTVHARTVHRIEAKSEKSEGPPGRWTLKIDEFVLPHQGIMVWWKKPNGRNNGHLESVGTTKTPVVARPARSRAKRERVNDPVG